jgi:dihydroceramidase
MNSDPVFHQNAFALITAIVLFRSMYIMEVNIRPSFRAKYATVPQKNVVPGSISKTQLLANEKRDKQIIKVMWVRRWRHEVGLPWGLLLEGHGWWLVIPKPY